LIIIQYKLHQHSHTPLNVHYPSSTYYSIVEAMDKPLQSSRYKETRGRNTQPTGTSSKDRKPSQHRSRSRSRSRDNHAQIHNERKKYNDNHHDKENRTDPNLPRLNDDPRSSDPSKRISSKALHKQKGRNTESFRAESTFVRPDLRVQIGSKNKEKYNKKLKHDDVVIVPEMFGDEDDWTLYYKLVEEMREIQQKERDEKGSEQKKSRDEGSDNRQRGQKKREDKSEWIPWHEGAHLISKNPTSSPTYQKIISKLCSYFNISNKSIGTRFNWYTDSNDWKPFHHDSAAFNPSRAKNQNITIGASFGAMRELAFIRTEPFASSSSTDNLNRSNTDGNKCKLYFPQSNNGVFSFGRDANIKWKHGINALKPSEQDGKGRISIILWGLAKDVIEEDGSPPLLGSDGTGPHAAHRGHGRRDRGKQQGFHINEAHHTGNGRRYDDGWGRDGGRYERHHNNNQSGGRRHDESNTRNVYQGGRKNV